MKICAYLIFLILILIVLTVDNSVYNSYYTPKNLLLFLLVPISLFIYLQYKIFKAKKIALSISIIEIFLLVRLIWLVISNPEILINPKNTIIWYLLILTIYTINVRQIFISCFSANANIYIKNLVYMFHLVMIFLGLIQAFIGFFQFAIKDIETNNMLKTLMLGTIGSANGYGLFIALSMISSFVMYKFYRKITLKVLFFISTIILLIALILNGSRGALFGLLSAGVITYILYIFIFNKHRSYSTILKKIWIRIGLIVIAIFCIGGSIWLLYQINPESAFGRIMIWKISAPMISNHPIFGIGYGNFGIKYLAYQAKYFENLENLKYAYKAADLKQAHNEYFQAFIEGGFIGGGLFLLICILAVWHIIKQLKVDQSSNKIIRYGIFIIFITILIHSLVDSPLHVSSILIVFYFILGIIPVLNISYTFRIKSFLSKLIITVSFMILIIFIFFNGIKQYNGYKFWKNGVLEAKQKKWEFALTNYREAITNLSHKGELNFHLGSAMVMSGEYSKGIFYLNKSLLNFQDKNIHLSLSYAYLKLKNLELAEKYAKNVLSMFPDHLAPHLLLGEIYFEQGELEKSRYSLLKCINRDTKIHSEHILQISKEAKELWYKFYE